MGFRRVLFAMFLLMPIAVAKNVYTFDVRKYGAVADGKTDNSKSLLKAWSHACVQSGGTSRVYIPNGVYMLGRVEFIGPCKSPVTFLVTGTLKAPIGPMNSEEWISFRYVDKLIVKGGTFDGQGASAWPYNQCAKKPTCLSLPASVSFQFVTNSRIKYIKSMNSKNAHLTLFACNNVNISKIELLAPADSPNTDGIKIGSSTNIHITMSKISTGDDCVAVLSGSSNIAVTQVYCGPGHGISVGSLGKNSDDENVSSLYVSHCTLNGTDNGVRIKTWESPWKSTASNFLFENIYMENVRNPIIIDQSYCPVPPCTQQTASHVQITDVTYRNIWGTSNSEVALRMECSKKFPCQNIRIEDIYLGRHGVQGPLQSRCSYVHPTFHGKQHPPPCP